ncbi:uncharacterized protein LOC129586952 isoform X2 [Paramacrobiotus metropolitanus]|uniref:uncharacterized protein LOC129586952 isoform X2 n=1 Tax=Paramacrobiotus metropolitanus TaxID=2943436 RepID=UPI002445F1AF|nr:uncharacterized protein LOC129586952 isoform X2 [Paramacrobiotus metropolitanus]
MLKFDDFLLFPFFVNISLHCVKDEPGWRTNDKLTQNPFNPVTVPVVARHGQSLILHDDLSICNKKCSLAEWSNFIHFGMDSNGEICPGVDFYKCECESVQCIGDTVIVGSSSGRFGTLWIPYSTPFIPKKDTPRILKVRESSASSDPTTTPQPSSTGPGNSVTSLTDDNGTAVTSDDPNNGLSGSTTVSANDTTLPVAGNGTTSGNKTASQQISDPRQGHGRADPHSFHAQWRWLDFCQDDFSEEGASVVCNQLQYSHHHYSSFEIQKAGLPSIDRDDDITYLPYKTICTGNETKLSQCKFKKLNYLQYNCTAPVTIYCNDATSTRFDNRSISGSPAIADIELLVFMPHIGKWSTVCRKNWTPFDNSLACEGAGKLDPFANAQAQSCWEHRFNNILHERPASSGIYRIYSTKWKRIIPVYCSMLYDGGGWTRVIATHYSISDEEWDSVNVLSRNAYQPQLDFNYSILEIADSLQVVDHKAGLDEGKPEYLMHIHYVTGRHDLFQVRYPALCSLIADAPCVSSNGSEEEPQRAEIINNRTFFIDSTLKDFMVPWFIMQDGNGFMYTLSNQTNGTKLLGVLLASNNEDRSLNSSDIPFRFELYVRTRNYRIKEPPEIDCNGMDYLLDGNFRVQNAQFSTSSVREEAEDSSLHDGFMSFLSPETGVSGTEGPHGWISDSASTVEGSWIGIDLLTPHKIEKVLVRGVTAQPNFEERWVKDFSLQKIVLGSESSASKAEVQPIFNSMGKNWFSGNHDASNITTNTLRQAVAHDDIRMLRLVPLNTQPEIPPVGLRWELIGCSRVPRSEDAFILEAMTNEALGMNSSRRNYRLGAPARDIWYSPACSSENFEIRLPETYLIKSIVVSGHPNRREVIGKFKLLFSRTGSSHHYKWYGANMDELNILEQDQPRIFLGPQDGSTPLYINFKYPWSARLLRFVVLEPRGTPCYVRLELIGRPLTDTCTMPLGMNSGNIADFQLTASSQYVDPCSSRKTTCRRYSYGPERARYSTGTRRHDLRGAGAWRPAVNDIAPWIQADLLAQTQLTAVIVQSSNLSYMSSFSMQYSNNGDTWYRATEWQIDETDRLGSFRLPSFLVYLTPPIYARHIKILPLQFNSFGAVPVERNVKFELLGCTIPADYHPLRPEFTRHYNTILHPDKHFDSYFYELNDTECADKCLQEKGFLCQGYYIKDSHTCILTVANLRSWDVKGHNVSMDETIFNQREPRCLSSLGLTNPKVIADSAFTASSNRNRASSARLSFRADGVYEKGWVPRKTDFNPYIQVTLPGLYLITGFHINGDGTDNFVRELKIEAFNGTAWAFCKNATDSAEDGYFDGNSDPFNVNTTWIPAEFQPRASIIRLYPVSYGQDGLSAFQFELTGCQLQETDLSYPMGFNEIKCSGNEQRTADCPHEMSDPNDIHCNFNTSVRPQCVTHCGDPGHRACGKRSGIHFFAPHQVTYECYDGSKQIIQCKDSGFWTSAGRSCVKNVVENVALLKSANQSSTSKVPGFQHAAYAVDGDELQNMRTCTFTNEEINPWWYVDLKQLYEIQSLNITLGFTTYKAEIRIGPRNPWNAKGALDFTVNPICFSADYPLHVGNDTTNTASIECKSGNPISDQEFGNSPVFGRFVSIQVLSSIPTTLSLCEVKVLAKPCLTNDVQDQAEFAAIYRSVSNIADMKSVLTQVAQEQRPEGLPDDTSSVGIDDDLGCTHAQSRHQLDDQPYVIYSPGGQVYVTGLTIETDRKPYELHDYEVRVGEYPRKEDFMKNGLCHRKRGYVIAGQKEVIKCERPLYGSYVIIMVTDVNRSYLSLCKVSIWGKLCDARLDAVHMRPLAASSYAPGSDIWVLINDDVACFETDRENSPWVSLDMAFPTEITTANFTLCDHVSSGHLELRVGDNADPDLNRVMATKVKITSLLSQTNYSVVTRNWPPLAGRYLSIHLMPTGGLQSLCVCNLTIARDRYCPTEHYHNVAYGIYPLVSSRDTVQYRPEVTTDGYHEHMQHLCFSTKVQHRPYWVIELPTARKVFTIRVVAKQDSNKEIRVGYSAHWRTNKKCGTIDNHSTGIKAFTISCVDENGNAAVGDKISIEVVDGLASKLTLCEVEVWGH